MRKVGRLESNFRSTDIEYVTSLFCYKYFFTSTQTMEIDAEHKTVFF